MREKNLFVRIGKIIDPLIHQQSMTGAAMNGNGIPDRYYDGKVRDLWVEFKQLKSIPREKFVRVAPVPNVKKQPQGKLTPMQQAWLLRRNRAGGNAWVIVGLPNNTAVVFAAPASATEVLKRTYDLGIHYMAGKPIALVANAIERFVNEGVEWTLG